MTARGIGLTKRSGATNRGGRREVSRGALAKRPRSSQNRAGRYQEKPKAGAKRASASKAKPAPDKDEQPAAPKPAPPDPPARKPSREMLALMRDWPNAWKAAAQKVVDFFERRLRFVKGSAAGKPFRLEPWQEKLLRRVFGPLNPDGTRVCRVFYLEVGSKNAKSTLIGGVALYMLTEDSEAGAEVYTCAKNRKQARLVFNSARAMALQSPYLRNKLNIFRHSIERKDDELSKMEPISSDAGNQDGVDPNCVVFDEVHRIRDRDIVDTLEAKQASRRSPLEVMITTAGPIDPDSIAFEKHEYAKGVIDGTIIDPTWVAAIYAVPDDVDWHDEKYWALANPNLGVSISIEFLRKEHKKALKNALKALAFRRFHMNQWVGAVAAWMEMESWDKCKVDVNVADLVGRVCASGLDLGSTRDLTSHVPVFPEPNDAFLIIARFFMPEELIDEREENDKKPYRLWQQQGWLTATPGNTISYRDIRESIEDDFATFKLKDLAFDRAGAAHMTQELNLTLGSESGKPEEEQLNIFPFPQTFLGMSEPTKDFYDMVTSGKIKHDGNPILRWMVECATAIQDNHGNVKLVKPDRRKHAKRIDGVIAAIMGTARAKFHKTNTDFGAGASVYEEEEMLVL